MPSTGTLGGTLPSGPMSLKVKHQAYSHDGSRGRSLLQPDRLSQITITGLEPRVQLHVAGRSENFLVDTGATYSVLISYSGAFSSQTCIILGATGKATTKRFTRALLCCWDGQILFHQFLVVPECPTPLLGRDGSGVGDQDRVGSPCVNQEILGLTYHIQLHPWLQPRDGYL